ncbi:GntR family transcriptional regulator [Actinoallomurus acanthiterrae]
MNPASMGLGATGGGPRPVKRASAVDLVLSELRRAIVHGALAPGQEIIATQLAADMGVSHIPVREALRVLANEGLVSLRSQRKAMVAMIDIQDLRDIYRLRILIEGDLAERSAPLYTDEDLSTIRDLFDHLGSDDTEGDLDVHGRFHRALVLPAASEWDLRILQTLWVASERHLRLLFANFNPGDAQYEHDQLLSAATRRDGPVLREALRRHLSRGIEILSASKAADGSCLEPTQIGAGGAPWDWNRHRAWRSWSCDAL